MKSERRPNTLRVGMTSCCRHLPETPSEDPFLGVQPVLCFVPHHRLRAIDDRRGDLFAALRRQAVHKDGVWLGVRHQMLVDAIPGQQVVTVDARLDTHRDPRVGRDAIGARHRLQRVGHQLYAAALAARPIEEALWRAELFGTGEPQREAEAYRRVHPADRDIVAVAAPGYDLTGE